MKNNREFKICIILKSNGIWESEILWEVFKPYSQEWISNLYTYIDYSLSEREKDPPCKDHHSSLQIRLSLNFYIDFIFSPFYAHFSHLFKLAIKITGIYFYFSENVDYFKEVEFLHFTLSSIKWFTNNPYLKTGASTHTF